MGEGGLPEIKPSCTAYSQHVGPEERVAVSGTSISHAVIHRMLLSLWYMEKCWSNKIGLTSKEVEFYMRAVGQFAIDWLAIHSVGALDM